jgi:excisionase family DNA binding protein
MIIQYPGNSHTTCFFKGKPVQSLLKPNEVAALLSISVKAVHALCRERKLNYIQINGKERRFTEEMVQDFIASRTVEQKRFDKKPAKSLPFSPKKGGKSSGVSRAQLREEMRSW